MVLAGGQPGERHHHRASNAETQLERHRSAGGGERLHDRRARSSPSHGTVWTSENRIVAQEARQERSLRLLY